MKNIKLTLFILSFTICNCIYPQIINSYKEAVEIFNTFPPIYEFEGIYEIFQDSKVTFSVNLKEHEYEQYREHDFEGFKSKGSLICIYHTDEGIKALIIGEEAIIPGAGMNDGWLNAFSVSTNGVLSYNFVIRSEGSGNFQWHVTPSNIKQSAYVEIKNSNLHFEERRPSMVKITTDYKVLFLEETIKYELKKKFSPPIPVRKSIATAFAISSDGYIVTNYKSINKAKKITIKGVNGDFKKQYLVKIISSDESNNLAILKIEDNMISLNKIPYLLSLKQPEIGNSIYVLGYPLNVSSGNEIELTSGSISAKTGYEGDVSTYQLSVSIQPGINGGPMFDKNGYLIGIVSSKVEGAEKSSFSIKTVFLANLIESLPISLNIPTISILSGLTIEDQVKSIKNFIYIIEVEL